MKKTIFWLLILILLVYSGIKFGMPYYRYWALKADVAEITKLAFGREAEVKTKIFERAQELNIPITESDVEVSRSGNTVWVRTSWFEVVDLLGVYQKTLKFTIDTST